MSRFPGADARLAEVLEREEYDLDDYINDRRQDIHQLVLRIKQQVSIDRHILGGSVGKGTCLGPDFRPDFDVNLFFNDRTQNSTDQELDDFLQDQLNFMHSFLSSTYPKEYKVIYKSAFALGVHIRRYDVKVDLIPAINFGNGDVQYDEVMDRIVDEGSNLVWINPCYSEASVRFMRDQDQFAINVIHLAKYWNKSFKIYGALSGRSVIVETVALKAAQDETYSWGRERSLRGALRRFLEFMGKDWKSLRIVVNNDSITSNWPSDALDEMDDWKRASGVVLDPVNPYRNFLDNERVQNQWGYFREAANDSLKQIDRNTWNFNWPIEEAIGLDRLD